MNRQHLHTDWAFLPRGQLPEKSDFLFRAEFELSSSFVKLLLNKLALLSVLLAVLVLTFLITIPNTFAGSTLLEGVTFLSARRAHLGWGPVCRGGFGILPLLGRTERHGTELLSRLCFVIFR